jgi:hypothetical protein
METTTYGWLKAQAEGRDTAVLITDLTLMHEIRVDALAREDYDSVQACNMVISATVEVLFDREPQFAAESDAYDENLDDERSIAEWTIDWFTSRDAAVTA